MKKICIGILIASMLVSPVSVCAYAKEPIESSVVDVSGHVEIEGEEPVYPEAPEGFKNYEDYKQNTGYVHDTEFYYEQETKTWYCYFTNSNEIRSSKDLVHWTKEDTNRGGNAWAPCIIKLREPVEYEGKTYTYALWDSASTFGTRNSQIRLWLSNSPKGEFVQAGNTVVSKDGDGKSHNAIDPSVFYDKDGKLWMTFGSFFGGIFLFELDPATCMPKNPDGMPGKRIAYRSSYGNSIEGPTILYNPDTDYYYLNVSYGSLDHTYNVRIGRSRNVEGPYYDYNGLPMDNNGYNNEQVMQIGTKITSPYYFEPDNGWYSTAHSAFLYNPDTNEYFLSHNARLETIAQGGTRLNIRKVYWTEDGWPVVSPELYVEGEKEQKIPTRCIPGAYQIVEMLREDLSVSPISAVKRGNEVIELKEDHTISGAYEGTWIQTGDHTLQLKLGDAVYDVTVSTAWDWENWTKCLVFTGLSEAADTPAQGLTEKRSGLGIWGKRADVEAVAKTAFEKYVLPETVISDITFPEISYKGVTIKVESLNPDVITSEGKLIQSRPEKDTVVDFKVTFSMEGYSAEKMISVTVPAYMGSLQADIQMNGNLRDSSSYNRKVTPGSGEYVYEKGVTGQALRNKKIGTNTDGLVRLENNILHTGNSEAFTINLWVRPDALTDHTAVFYTRGDGRWMTMMPCSNTSKTPAIRVRDDAAGVWYDLEAPSAIQTGEWSMLTYVYDKGTTILYINGQEAAKSADILNPFNSVSQSFYLGGNSWDASFDGLIDEVKVYDEAVSAKQLKAYYEKTLASVKPADKKALESELESAKKQAELVKVSVDGKDIDKNDVWVTEDVKEGLMKAIEQAEAVIKDADADQNLTDAAAEELKAKARALELKKKNGTKEEAPPEPPVIKLPYKDVVKGNADHKWFYDAVEYCYENELMKGKDTDCFAPFENIVRAQFAVILHRMQGAPEMEYTGRFADVASEIWYTDAILWAASKEIVTGYTGTKNFGPADNINREQMAVMMYRYANSLGYDTKSSQTDYSKFEDASKVTGYAQEAMRWAVGSGIITGKYNETIIDPQGYALRAECAIIIQRFMNAYEK